VLAVRPQEADSAIGAWKTACVQPLARRAVSTMHDWRGPASKTGDQPLLLVQQPLSHSDTAAETLPWQPHHQQPPNSVPYELHM